MLAGSTDDRHPLRRLAVSGLTASLLAVSLGLASPFGSPHTAVAAPVGQGVCAGNLLANPAFDGGFRKTEHLGTSLSSAVSDAWIPWFVRGNDATWNREPEFKVVIPGQTGDAYRVMSGTSMKWFTTWATHDAGVYQRVAVPVGAPVTFSAHGMIYSGEADGHRPDLGTFFSDPEKHGGYQMAVGIDPYGNTPAGMGSPPPDTVVWSPANGTTDQFVKLSTSSVAQAGAVTVYLRGWAQWPVKHNDSFWENACLTRGGAPAQPEPAPGDGGTEVEAVGDGDGDAADAGDPAAGEEAYPAPGASADAGTADADRATARRNVTPLGSHKLSGRWALPR